MYMMQCSLEKGSSIGRGSTPGIERAVDKGHVEKIFSLPVKQMARRGESSRFTESPRRQSIHY